MNKATNYSDNKAIDSIESKVEINTRAGKTRWIDKSGQKQPQKCPKFMARNAKEKQTLLISVEESETEEEIQTQLTSTSSKSTKGRRIKQKFDAK